MRVRLSVVAVAAVAVLALPGAGAGAGGGGTWVGPLQGSNAFVAIVRDAQQIAAYVCDNGTVGSWFFGPDGTADNVQLAGRDGSRLAIELDGQKATGTYTRNGHAYKFEARATDKHALWRAEATDGDSPILAGWIQNGSESRGTLSFGSTLTTAPSLSPSLNFTSPFTPTLTITLTPAPMTPDTLSGAFDNTGSAGSFFWGAAGDSFASGEGNPEHGINNSSDPNTFTGLSWGNDSSMYVGTAANFQADITTCHRSDRAGAPKAQATLKSLYPGMTFVLGFVACSGAKTSDLLNDGYKGPSAVPTSMLGYSKIAQDAQLTQLDDFRTLEGGRLDAIYMSIGGNDAGFGDIVADCISPFGPSDCGTTWSPTLTTRLNNVSTSYDNVASRINTLFGSSIPVFLSDYPNPIDNGADAPCQGDDYNAHADVGFGHWDDALKNNVTVSEANFAYGIPDRLNAAVSAAVSAHPNWNEISTHTAPFIGHGICTASPDANLNSAALRRQGRDVPNTSFFLFSSGFMHPNNSGYAQYGSAIVDSLRPIVDQRARLGLNSATNLRVGAATQSGNITIHWNDRSYTENAYDVEVLPARPQDAALIDPPSGSVTVSSANGAGFRVRVTGTDGEEYVHQVSGGGQFLYRVRACQSGISIGSQCGPYTARITGTNVLPAMPTSVAMTVQTGLVNGVAKQTDLVTWAAQTDATQYVVRVEAANTSPVETRTPTTSFSQNHVSGATYKVAACNRVGCSGYVTATAG
jgi:lysophospholipase L1-like esterase